MTVNKKVHWDLIIAATSVGICTTVGLFHISQVRQLNSQIEESTRLLKEKEEQVSNLEEQVSRLDANLPELRKENHELLEVMDPIIKADRAALIMGGW